ncbi:MAG: glutathione binding-like protein [Myxococcota bacterium]
MKLYFAPAACSIAAHSVLIEAKLPFEAVKVDFMRGRATSDGGDFWKVNPLGYVPALLLDDGQLLTEGAIIMQYIADLAPESHLAPPLGSFERVRMNELLHFMATELHKGMGPFFGKTANDEYKAEVKQRLTGRLTRLANHVEGKPWLFGDRFTIADAYSVYLLRTWKNVVKGDLGPTLGAYYARLVEHPSVKAAMAAEGIQP